MSEELVQFMCDSIYGDEYSKDNKKYMKQKLISINKEESSLFIKDKEQSKDFIEGLENLIREDITNKMTVVYLRNTLQTTIKPCDWDYISDLYQKSLLEMSRLKTNCKDFEKSVEEKYYNKLKDNVSDTAPYQDLFEMNQKLSTHYYELKEKYDKLN